MTAVTVKGLSPDWMQINVAEYIALLITCETFAEFCRGKVTDCELDNTFAQSWFLAARCPKSPFDRCGQGLHLYMLERGMKVRTRWVPSASNTIADVCSRIKFSSTTAGNRIGGILMRKVKPRWLNVIKFLN